MSSLAEDYLKGYGGSPEEFLKNMEAGQRIGQAFFNALSDEDQELVGGSEADPFYSNFGPVVHKAINYLLEKKS